MGFLSKIGNVLQDTASFAAPAGLALGATALTGGNPFAGKALLAALGAGAKGLQANEQEERARKMMKRQNQNNATANLINTLSPTARYQPNQAKAPRAGMLETLSGGVGMGVDAFQTAQMLQQAAERAAAEKGLIEAQMGYYKGRTDAAGKAMGTGAKQAVGKPEDTYNAIRDARRYGQDVGNVQLQNSIVESPYNTRTPDVRNANLGDVADFGGPINTQVRTAIAEGDSLRGADTRQAQKEMADLAGDLPEEGRDWSPILSVIETDPRQYMTIPPGERVDALAAMKDAGWSDDKIRDLTRTDISGTTLDKFNELVAADRTFRNLQSQLEGLGSEFVGVVDGMVSGASPETRRKVKDFDSSLQLVTQSLGRALQGRMTDQDLKLIQEIVGDRGAVSFADLQGRFDALSRFLQTGKAVFAESLDAGNIRRPNALQDVDADRVDALVDALLGMQ